MPEITRPFPRTRRSQWSVVERVAPRVTEAGRWVEFEYQVHESDLVAQPFVIVNHKAQLRTDHHRVVQGPNGGSMHRSGTELEQREDVNGDPVWVDASLPPNVVVDFTLNPLWHIWTGEKDAQGRWLDTQGRAVAPFIHATAPWAGGADEELDPQWQRETFTLPIAAQVPAIIQRRLDRIERKREFGDKRGTTLNLVVGASSDDAYQLTSDTVFITDTTDLSDAVTEHFGWRFTSVTIAGGATIDSAFLTVEITNSSSDEPQHQVKGQAADNAGTFVATDNNIDSRTRTTASVQWNSADLGAGNTRYEWGAAAGAPTAGADIKAIIQEITDRAGWASGNAIALIAEQHTASSTRDLAVLMYDNASADAAALDIDYTAGSGAITLQSIAGIAAVTNLVVAAPILIPLGAVAGVAAVTNLVVATPATVVLQAIAGIAAVTNLVSSPVTILLDAIAGVASLDNIALLVPSLIALQSIAGIASIDNLLVSSPTYLTLQSIDGVASLSNLVVASPVTVVLQGIAGVASLDNVEIVTFAIVVLQQIDGVAGVSNLIVASPAALELQDTAGVAVVANLEVETPGGAPTRRRMPIVKLGGA